MELSGLRRRKWNQRRHRGCGEYHRGLIVKVTSARMIDAGPGCFCQPVRWLECLMFSLLVALLCIFLCQRRWAIWTARALQRPAGHPSSSWRPQCSASAECWWFVMTREPADRQVSYKKNTHPFPILSCIDSIAAPVMGGGATVSRCWRLTVASSY